ncbi:DMT family transporter [Gloeothece verrucosa]|uniref:EamA domain-containing protein n=1 Tax=Gloeothece verrucosa (strain PCC 7822) TaxID=497965 RepID=E0U531_GLOV7|nr:DMT family transporter [Gloeothece verrucosa]ADN12310.1 protein of unknown function DUF6 transmembrane [Gloeothece verrucosa PCC 7822]
MEDLRIIGIFAGLGSAASWAMGSILFKRLGERISPLAMTFAKGSLSIILLALALAFIGYESIEEQSLLLLILSGLLGIAVSDTLFFEALQDLEAHSLVLLMTFGQVFTVVLAVLFLGEQPSRVQWAGIFLIVLGITVVLISKITGEEKASRLKGMILGLLAVICMSVSLIIIKDSLDSVSALSATFIRMISGTTGILFLGVITNKLGRWMLPFSDVKLGGLFVVSVCVVTFGGFWLSIVAFKYLDVAIANTLISTEPLFVLPLAAIFAQEKVTLKAVVGTAITTTGIILLCRG